MPDSLVRRWEWCLNEHLLHHKCPIVQEALEFIHETTCSYCRNGFVLRSCCSRCARRSTERDGPLGRVLPRSNDARGD